MILTIILIGHMIADFFLQPSSIAEKKKKCTKYVIIHSLIYLLVFAAIYVTLLTTKLAVLSTVIISVTHFLIDLIRVYIDKSTDKSTKHFASFCFDQVFHISIIIVVYYVLKLDAHTNSLYCKLAAYPNFKNIILYIFLFGILLDPTAVFIKKLFSALFKKSEKNVDNTGKMIGMLERVITAILLLCNQYSAIGFVLTAKSIARFKQLEDKTFAEKYLIGTLTSLLISLAATLIIKEML